MVTSEQSPQIQERDAPRGAVTAPPQSGKRCEQAPSQGTLGAPVEGTKDIEDSEDAARIIRAVLFRYEHEIDDWIAKEEGIDRPGGPDCTW